MLSKPHRQFCEGIVTGLSGVRAYKAAYPRCSLKTARFNASHLRAKPHIQEEIARLRAQAEAIAGPAVLTLIEKRRWLARVVRANLALLDLEKDGDLLVSLRVEQGGKKPRIRKLRIANKIAAIKLDHQLSGDDAGTGTNDPVRDAVAEMIVNVVEAESTRRTPAAPASTSGLSPTTAASPSFQSSQASDSYPAASPDLASRVVPHPSESPPSPAAPVPPTDYIPPVFPPPRPRFYPGPDYKPRRALTWTAPTSKTPFFGIHDET